MKRRGTRRKLTRGSRRSKDGSRSKPVTFLSRKAAGQRNQPECLAMKWASDTLRYYLLG